MRKHLIDFKNITWTDGGKGIRYKAYKKENQQFRLVEFTEGFVEEDWCRYGHAGYLLEGSFAIDFNGETERYEVGEMAFIPQGEEDKHKAIIGKGERVLLLLFELI